MIRGKKVLAWRGYEIYPLATLKFSIRARSGICDLSLCSRRSLKLSSADLKFSASRPAEFLTCVLINISLFRQFSLVVPTGATRGAIDFSDEQANALAAWKRQKKGARTRIFVHTQHRAERNVHWKIDGNTEAEIGGCARRIKLRNSR